MWFDETNAAKAAGLPPPNSEFDDQVKITLDAELSDLGVEQASLLQSLMNTFTFPMNKVYCSPLRRTIQTLCNALASHPQKKDLTIILVPLAKEVFYEYGNVPLRISELK